MSSLLKMLVRPLVRPIEFDPGTSDRRSNPPLPPDYLYVVVNGDYVLINGIDVVVQGS